MQLLLLTIGDKVTEPWRCWRIDYECPICGRVLRCLSCGGIKSKASLLTRRCDIQMRQIAPPRKVSWTNLRLYTWEASSGIGRCDAEEKGIGGKAPNCGGSPIRLSKNFEAASAPGLSLSDASEIVRSHWHLDARRSLMSEAHLKRRNNRPGGEDSLQDYLWGHVAHKTAHAGFKFFLNQSPVWFSGCYQDIMAQH